MQIQINDSSEKSTSRLSACICNGRVYQAPWWIRGLKVHITKPASWAGDRLGSICSEQSHLSSCNHPIHRVEWQTPPSHLSCWQTSHPVLRLSTVGDMPVFVRYLHFMILHRYPVWFLMWCLSAWQMKWVVTSGPLMNQGVTGWQMVSRVSHNTPPYPTPNTLHPTEGQNYPCRDRSTCHWAQLRVWLWFLFRIIKELQGCFYLKNVYPF